MDEEETSLIVRHLPAELTSAEQEDLLHHFGATHVRTMGASGQMKHVAFATFPNHGLAAAAVKRLHQMEILGTKLVVEFCRNRHKKFLPSTMDSFKKVKEDPPHENTEVKKLKVLPQETDLKKIAEKVNCISTQWQVEYTLDPRLEYIYPSPTVNILTNIANALASVPRFYVQVLHLMNKMNLPAPFGHVTPTPVLPEGNPVGQHQQLESSTVVEAVSTEESEIESEEETDKGRDVKPSVPLKRRKGQHNQARKKPKLIQNLVLPTNKPRPVGPKPSEVFEQPHISGPKKIEFRLTGETQNDTDPNRLVLLNDTRPIDEALPGAPPLPPLPSDGPEHVGVHTVNHHIQGQGVVPSQGPPPLPPPTDSPARIPVSPFQTATSYSAVQEPSAVTNNTPIVVQGGFGIIERVVKPSEQDSDTDNTADEWGASEFIQSRELKRGRISSSEMRELSVFRNYDQGEPSSRLYIKNLAKQTTEKDLHYIYGRYVDWSKMEDCNMFDIRLMKEGRMKGQAFITLPNTKCAQDAVRDTNGYVFHGKPVVVHFARSAKPKDDAKDKDKKIK